MTLKSLSSYSASHIVTTYYIWWMNGWMNEAVFLGGVFSSHRSLWGHHWLRQIRIARLLTRRAPGHPVPRLLTIIVEALEATSQARNHKSLVYASLGCSRLICPWWGVGNLCSLTWFYQVLEVISTFQKYKEGSCNVRTRTPEILWTVADQPIRISKNNKLFICT